MNLRHPILQAAALVLLAIVCALTANASADRQRQLVLVGHYPNALRVPSRSAEPAPLPAAAVATAATPSTATPLAPPTESATATAAPVVPPPTTPTTSSIAAVKPTAVPATTTKAAPVAPATTAGKTAPLTATTAPAAAAFDPSRFAPHPDKAFVEIAYRDVAALHDAGALFLDARRTSVYEQGHIAGARSISVWEADLEEKVRKLFDERSDPREQAKPIVAYCSGGDCEDSHMLAEKLWGIQFNNVYVYKDGFPDWQKHGGAVHQGSNP